MSEASHGVIRAWVLFYKASGLADKTSSDLETGTDNFVNEPQTESLCLSACLVSVRPPHFALVLSVWTREPLGDLGVGHIPTAAAPQGTP